MQPDRVPWPAALKAGLVASMTPLAVLLAASVLLRAPGVVFPLTIAAVGAGFVLARRLVAREGFVIRMWILVVGFIATVMPAYGGGAFGITAGWLLVSTALVRLASSRTTIDPDPSVSEL